MKEQREFYTVDTISEALGISKRTIRVLLNTGKIKGKKICGKYIVTKQQLNDFIENSK